MSKAKPKLLEIDFGRSSSHSLMIFDLPSRVDLARVFEQAGLRSFLGFHKQDSWAVVFFENPEDARTALRIDSFGSQRGEFLFRVKPRRMDKEIPIDWSICETLISKYLPTQYAVEVVSHKFGRSGEEDGEPVDGNEPAELEYQITVRIVFDGKPVGTGTHKVTPQDFQKATRDSSHESQAVVIANRMHYAQKLAIIDAFKYVTLVYYEDNTHGFRASKQAAAQ